jgi:hypothetical protein
MTLIRKIYLYLFSFIGLALIVIGCVQLVNLGLKAYVFTAADRYISYPIPAPASPAGANAPTTAPAQPTDAEMQTYQNEQTTNQREQTAANALAMILVGVPLYLYHWHVIRKDKEG